MVCNIVQWGLVLLERALGVWMSMPGVALFVKFEYFFAFGLRSLDKQAARKRQTERADNLRELFL